MSVRVGIDYNSRVEEITIPVSFKSTVEAYLTPVSEEMSIGVSNFPSFIQGVLQANLALIRADIKLNMLAQQLIISIDPISVTSMDDISLGELDIGQDKTFYSI